MNTRLSAIGFAVQTAQGAAAAQPEFWHPVAGGDLVTFALEQKEDELTSAQVGGIGEYRESAAVAAEYDARAWPRSIGGLLYAALGAIATTGSAAPYQHVITPDASLPWVSVFAKKDTDLKSASDCKLDELTLEWDGNQPIKTKAVWAGIDAGWALAEFVPVLDESLLPYLKGIGLAATIDFDGSGYDGGAKVLSGSLSIKRNLTADTYSGSLLAGDIFEGILEIDVELKVRVPDLLPVRLLLTGTVDGTSVTGTVPYGKFGLTFTDGADSLAFAATRVAYKAKEPGAEPKGGPAELTLTGRCYGSTPLTATVTNGQAAY